MLENLTHSINIVLPVILLMALGWVLRRAGFLNEEFIRMGTRLAFAVAFPCAVFSNLAGLELSAIFNWKLLAYLMASFTLTMLVLLWIIPRLVHDKPTAASLTQAAFRANFLIQGIPLLENTYGAGNIAEGAFLLPFAILANNILATVIFVALIPEQRAGSGSPVVGALKKMAVNPLIVASVVGLIFSAIGLSLPALLQDSVTQVAHLGTPLALICMGAELRFDNLRRDLKLTIPTVLVRLVVIPFFSTLGAILLGFRGIALGSIYLFTATCTATSGYVMSGSMGGNSDISAQCVCLSSALSAFTMTGGLFVLLQLGLI